MKRKHFRLCWRINFVHLRFRKNFGEISGTTEGSWSFFTSVNLSKSDFQGISI